MYYEIMNSQLSVSLPIECIRELKRIAANRAAERGEQVSVNSLVKEALYGFYKLKSDAK